MSTYNADMKKIFLATSFSGHLNEQTGEVRAAYRSSIEAILKSLRSQPGVEVFCAPENDGWKLPSDPPAISLATDLARLDEADMLIALIQDKPSVGVQFEMGYAIAKDKQVVLAMAAGADLGSYNQGLVSAGLLTLVAYDTPADLKVHLPLAVNEPEGPRT